MAKKWAKVKWSLVGEHNMHNGLMAIAAARHVGVAPADAANALGSFINARRRLELRGEANGVTVYDDFALSSDGDSGNACGAAWQSWWYGAHYCCAGAALEYHETGICKDDLAPSLGRADEVFLLQPAHIPWQVAEVAEACVQPAHWSGDVDTLADMVVKTAQPGDHILVMSNGGFGGSIRNCWMGWRRRRKPRSNSALARYSVRRPDKAFTPHPALSNIVPDVTLDASYQAYRCTVSGKPYSHQQRKLPFVLR